MADLNERLIDKPVGRHGVARSHGAKIYRVDTLAILINELNVLLQSCRSNWGWSQGSELKQRPITDRQPVHPS